MSNRQGNTSVLEPLSGIAMHAFLALASESRPEKIPLAIVRATSHALLSDMCYLVSTPENGKITCFDGFDRTREEILPGLIIPSDHFVEIVESFNTGKPRLENDPAPLTESTQKVLQLLGQVQPAPFCFVPIISPAREVLGGLLLLSPYTGRKWNKDDVVHLLAISDSAARILERVLRSAELEDRIKRLEEQPKPVVESTGDWIVEATGETVPSIEPQPVPEKESVVKMASFIHQPSNIPEIYRAENDLLLFEISNLRQQLEQLAASTSLTAAAQTDKGTRLALEQIRSDLHAMLSPLSAITGYHDLLISESVGTLTTMQQKFLERIRSAADKLHHTIDHMDQMVTGGASGQISIPEKRIVSLQKVIEDTFKDYQQIIQDRALEVRMVTPDELPPISGTYDEIQPVVNKIVNSLLSITPSKANIQSRLALQVEMDGKKNVLWKATTHAETEVLPGKELDEFSEYLQENIFALAERLNCQLWMDAAVHTERQVNLLFAAA